MDRNITEKEDVCGVYKEGQLVWSCLQWYYSLFWCLLCEIT
jgi:hypothetical protein